MKTAKIGEFFWIKLDKKEIMMRANVLPPFEKRFLSLKHGCLYAICKYAILLHYPKMSTKMRRVLTNQSI